MSTSSRSVLRWVALVPISLAASGLAQVVFFWVSRLVLRGIFNFGLNQAMWPAKTLTSAAMAASLVLMATWIAPSHKELVAGIAFAVAVAWSGGLVAGAFVGDFFIWLFVMGICGLVGAISAFILSRRMLVGSSAA